MNEDIKITACIICKNEEACIETMLKSIQWVDEICILDTGSTDKTIEIAKKYTEMVYQDKRFYNEETKTFDFWWARNKAKEYASNQYIISLDCDEELITEWWIGKMKEMIRNNPEADAIWIKLWGWWNSYTTTPRLFRKELDWYWNIHETVCPKNRVNSDIVIKYWTSPTHIEDPYLDMRILEQEHIKEPTNTRIMYYLWREYFYHHKWEEAKKIFEKYITIWIFFEEVTDAMWLLANCYRYDWLWNGEKSREYLMKVILRNVNFKVAYKMLSEQMIDQKKKETWLKFAEIATNEGMLFIH